MKLKKKLMSLALVMAMAVCMLPMSGMAKVDAEGNAKVLNASELEAATLEADTVFGDFTIKALSGKTVTIDSNSKSIDGFSFTQRIKLGGTAATDSRSIHFATEGAATVTVYAISSSSSADRELGLYKADGTAVSTQTALGASITKCTYDIAEAGAYYIGSASSGINVYYISVEAAEAGVEDTDTTTQENMYVQYKEQGDGKYTLRFVVPVALDTIDTLDGVGVSMTANGYTELVAGKDLFSSLWADGEVVYAPEGYAFAIIELTNVPSGTQFTEVKPAYVPETGETTYGSSFTYTVQ